MHIWDGRGIQQWPRSPWTHCTLVQSRNFHLNFQVSSLRPIWGSGFSLVVLCRSRDVSGDKQGDKQCYHRYLNFFFSHQKILTASWLFFSCTCPYQRHWRACSPNSQTAEKLKLKKGVIHSLIFFVFLSLSLHFLLPCKVDDKVASPQTYLSGGMLKFATLGDLTLEM